MEDILGQFKKVAPFIVSAVKSRISPETPDVRIGEIINEEIVSYFVNTQEMTNQVLSFNEVQSATFAAIMYNLLKPMTEKFKHSVNPLYAEYVKETGKTGALNYITKA